MGEETQCTRTRAKKLCGYKNAPIFLDRAFRLLWVFLKVALNEQFVKEQEMMKLRKSGLHEGLPKTKKADKTNKKTQTKQNN